MAKKTTKKSTSRRGSISSIELNHQRVLAKLELAKRKQKHIQAGILSEDKFLTVHKQAKQGFVDIMKTTLGSDYSSQGLLREIRPEDLQRFIENIDRLQGQYEGGISAEQVINASLPIDRKRASKEIPWAAPVASRYLGKAPSKAEPLTQRGAKQSLVLTFVTAASGKYRATKHFVNVEFLKFGQITKHLLMEEPNPTQAEIDAQLLKNSAICFDCDCGRHTYWYRYIASIGKFAYIGTNPIGRKETGYPKIRNPQLKGIACKHVLKVMQTILHDKSVQNFLIKAILKKYKAGTSAKNLTTQTTKKEMEKTISKMKGEHIAILSSGEKFIAPKLLERYRRQLTESNKTRKNRDLKNAKQKMNILATLHNVEEKLKYLN